ncbi:pilus assembly protein TadG-related protein [Lysobacter korlensis]|uniref:Pilus assembly protein TadG-related protein n=1 Tax=Lysobacter korlensis TaxID=553636 RepID=A0ABV6RXF6_9GAMM
MRRARADGGSILPLTACFGALALVLVLLVTAATSLHLERKRLLTLADAAALAGAESFELADVELTEEGPRPVLQGDSVRDAVVDFVGRMPLDGFEELTVAEATTTDGRSASVTLTSRWRPPVMTLFLPEGVAVEVTSVARSVFG